MAIGERIRFIRNLLGMTQKYLGLRIGYQESTADVRIAQYESGTRKPKDDLVESIAYVLEVSPLALKVPDIDSYVGLMHTLFTLEDIYGLTIEKKDGKTVFRFDSRKGNDAERISKMVDAWADMAEKYHAGEISREEYDRWRYRYPEFDKSQKWVKMPSNELGGSFNKKGKIK